jgi:hypothetical protein
MLPIISSYKVSYYLEFWPIIASARENITLPSGLKNLFYIGGATEPGAEKENFDRRI